jgi:ABC-2 type transport system ATP-binding protein
MTVIKKAIDVDHVVKDLTTRRVLKDISFDVEEGHIHGLIGMNGAGKSTLMNLLSGLTLPTRGKVSLFGESQREKWDPQWVGYLPEVLPLYPNMTVKAYWSFVACIYRIPKLVLEERQAHYCERFQLQEAFYRSIGHLSKGTQQKVALTSVCLRSPRLLILDEPMNGLDPQSQQEIRELLDEMKGKQTVVISSHLLYDMGLTCSHLTLLHEGQILYTGSMEDLKQRFCASPIYSFELNHMPETLKLQLQSFHHIYKMIVKKKSSKLYEIQFCPSEQAKGDQVLLDMEKLCGQKGLSLLNVKQETWNLEHYFRWLTQEQL